MTTPAVASRRWTDRPPGSPDELIRGARTRERDGCIAEAMEAYRTAIAIAEVEGPQRALAEAQERRAAQERAAGAQKAAEVGGRDGPEPTRYGDWEKGGIVSDF